MKKIPALLVALLFISQGTVAQKISLGCKSGIDFVNNRYVPTSADLGLTKRLSFDFGLIINYSPIKKLQVQIESGFIEKGGQYKFVNFDEKIIFKYGYFSNQLVFILQPIRRLNIELGPEVGYLLYAKQKEIPGQLFNLHLSDFNKFELSSIAGLSFNFFDNVYLTFKYVYAVTPLIKSIVQVDPGPSYSYKTYNQYLSIGLRYYFIKIF
jgi:opacity protein-like surface antigen